MKTNLNYIFFVLLVIACNTVRTNPELIEIESFIQERPDSAYTRLKQIDQAVLKSRKDKALYSLLYSMALDKNYIDVTSDSLIAPAVSYYSSRGDRYHRFLTFYYQGRVYENDLNYTNAMDSFLAAEKVMDKSVSKEYKNRLYSSKLRIYYHQFALDRALEEALKSKEISKDIGNPLYFVRSSLDVASFYRKIGDNQKAIEELNELDVWLTEKNLPYPIKYYESRFRIALTDTTVSAESIVAQCDEYKAKCESSGTPVNNMLVAEAMSKAGRVEEAEKAFALCKEPAPDDEFAKVLYYAEESTLYQSKGDFEKALLAELKYQTAVENINLSVFNNDIRFLEERYQNTMQEEKNLRRRIVLSVAVAMLLVGLTVLIVVFRKREKRYKEAVSDAKAEYAFINHLMEDSDKGMKALRDTLGGRMNALRPYLYNDSVTPSVFSPRKDLEHIDEGRKEMLRSIGMVYALSYPAFTETLVSYGLSSEEVGLCALYVAGYSTKEMNDYLHSGSILHINGNIRRKIGEPVEGLKLHTWLKQTFMQTEQS